MSWKVGEEPGEGDSVPGFQGSHPAKPGRAPHCIWQSEPGHRIISCEVIHKSESFNGAHLLQNPHKL